MKTYELLDRFETLYPRNLNFADLRRAYIDNDLNSIFRLAEIDKELLNPVTGDFDDLRKAVVEQNLHSIFRLIQHTEPTVDVDELRKAVVEQNLHSIFRLINDDDMRKLILENNTWKLWPILERYVETQFIAAFKNFFVNEIEIDNDCFSRGQLQSKMWLIKELKKTDVELGTVFLCAGWYATLAVMLFESTIKVDKIRSFDIDFKCEGIAKVFNKPWVIEDWKFQAATQDIHSINFEEHVSKVRRADGSECNLLDIPNTIINTSCEHIENFADWYDKIPEGKLVILQSNNYFEVDEHVNCVESVSEFSKIAPMKAVLFSGELDLPKYTRFMLIGYK